MTTAALADRPSPADDLVARAARGDRDAEREVCRRLFPALRAFARRRLRGAEAEDFAQDALIAFVEAVRAGRLEDPSKAASYALGICRRMAADRARGRERREELLARFADTDGFVPAWEQPCALGRDHLEDCLSQLTRRARDIVRATFHDEATDREIADRLGIALGNVRVIRHRTLAALRECLEQPISWRAP